MRNAEDLANGLSLPRHGIERLLWLKEQWVWPEGVMPPVDFPKHQALGAERTQIEVASALIEELHDALAEFRIYLVATHMVPPP
jgi:hypothetical protein